MWRRKKRDMEPTSKEATAARIRAEMDLERRLIDTSRVRELTAEWRRIRERNNIAAAFEISMRGRHP
jgi:hypothetical protein